MSVMKGLNLPKPVRGVQLALIGLYIAQAIPVYLFGAALPAIFRERGLDLATIGSLGVLMLPWIIKFLWAPWVDRFQPKFLGPRKGWIVPLHLCVVGLVVIFAFLDPAKDIHLFFPLAMTLALMSATQDIATDGYAVEHLTADQLAFGNAIQGGSIAAGVLIGGASTLFFYDYFGWTVAVLIAAGLAFLSLVPFLCVAETVGRVDQALGQPVPSRPSLLNFLKRKEARSLLYFALIFRCSEGLVKAMEQPFMVDKGLSLSALGLLSGGAAATVGLGGAAIAALLIANTGLKRFLWGIGLSRTVCFVGFFVAAFLVTVSPWFLVGLSFLNTVIRYMELVGLYSLFMKGSSKGQAATDFTFLACANLFVYMLGSMLSGVIARSYGYEVLFGLASVLSLIGIVWAMQQLRSVQSSVLQLQSAAENA